MFYYIVYQMLIDQPLVLLACVHKAFFTDPVDAARYPRRFLIDIIHGLVCEYLLLSSCISQMGKDMLFRLRPVQVGEDAVYVNALSDGRITLQAEFLPQQYVVDSSSI